MEGYKTFFSGFLGFFRVFCFTNIIRSSDSKSRSVTVKILQAEFLNGSLSKFQHRIVIIISQTTAVNILFICFKCLLNYYL